MNPLYWEDAVQRLQRKVVPNHQSGVNNSMGGASRTSNDWDTHCEYSVYTANEPHSSMGVNVSWEGLGPSSHKFLSLQPEVEDTDGEPLEMDTEDPELARKRKELREIEEQIMRKKVALALKKVQPFVTKTPPGYSCNEQSTACKGETLQDRVNRILQQRHSLSFLSKVQSPNKGTNSSSMCKDDLLHKDHPLKLRVKTVMKQRCSDLFALPSTMEVHVKLPPPSQSSSSPAKEENNAEKGFQRFLSVLNKGVDMDLLSRIVSADSEDLTSGEEILSIQLPALENTSDLPCSSASKQLNSGASILGLSLTSSGESKAEPPSLERSYNERQFMSDDGEKKNDRLVGPREMYSRSESPPAAKKKKITQKEEEEKAKADEQHEQLQNILKTVGLDLEVEEMSKLADRTQERLYGKNPEIRHRADSRGDQKSRLRASHRHNRNVSSSSSSSSSSSPFSSRSTSRSFSPSPSRRWCSHSRDYKQRRTPENSHSRSRSREQLLVAQDCNQNSREAQRPRERDKDKNDHQHPADQTYPHPHPDNFSSFPDYNLSHYYGDNYSASADSYWTYTQGAIHPSGFPHPQNAYHQFPGPAASPNVVYPHHKNAEEISFFLNPDLSTSEGQVGSASGLRCLHIISTKDSAPKNCIKQLTKGSARRRGTNAYMKKRYLFFNRRKEQKKIKRLQKLGASQTQSRSPLLNVDTPLQVDKAEQSEDIKRELTEEEIKANLRKKLEAFNQKVKQQLAQSDAQPGNSLIG